MIRIVREPFMTAKPEAWAQIYRDDDPTFDLWVSVSGGHVLVAYGSSVNTAGERVPMWRGDIVLIEAAARNALIGYLMAVESEERERAAEAPAS